MDPQPSALGEPPSSSSPRHSPPPSNQAPKPRGILKNPLDRRPSGTEDVSEPSSAVPPLRVDTNGINWDEANIALHDFEKESTQRMKIDEPKTPFVRGSGSSIDDEGGFDAFNLDASMGESPRSTAAGDASRLAANTSANAQLGHAAPPPSGRTGSTSAVGLDAADLAGVSATSASPSSPLSTGPRRPSLASRSSRSPSFSLPASGTSSRRASNRSNSGLAGGSDSRSRVRADASAMDVDGSTEHAIGADDDDEEDDDEETRAQKAAFAQKRNAHYGNEAEALKVAKALAAQEDEDDDEEDSGAIPPVPSVPNGV